ncbi:MAG: HlyD family efflux transporter periplasmic adaptor subunit [Phycisphaerales bacterium]|nr:HlyD family efflux transporter periplasmic adaptor subunit [Phycisphaerales bacterium]
MNPADSPSARAASPIAGPRPRRKLAPGMAKVVWIAGLVVVAGGITAITLSSGSPEGAANAAVKADRAVARKMTFDVSTTASGSLEAKNETILRSKLETRSTIVEVVPEGSFVKKGDVLVKLNSDETEKQIDQVVLEVESAKSELVAAQNGVEIQKIDNDSKLRQANLKVELARLALSQWVEGEHKQKLKDLAVDLETSERDFNRLQAKYDRSVTLERDGFLSKDEKEQDWIALKNAEARFEKAKLAKETYDSYEEPKNRKTKNSDLDEAIAELSRVAKNADMDLTIKTAAASNRQQQLTKRETKLAELKEQLANSTIVAPADGMVVYATSMERFRRWDQSGKLQIGQDVNPNQELIILPDTSVMVASVKVHESLAGRVKEGMPATIKVEAAGGATFSGKVDSKGIMADDGGWWDQTRQYSVKVAIDAERASGLKPADNCEATIVLGTVEQAITVPIQAIFTDGPVRFVYSQAGGGRFTRIPVRIGRTSDTLAEIEKGLNEGQVVLLRDPIGGEFSPEPWKKEMLLAAGYQVGEDGQPLPEAGPRRPGTPGGPGGPGAVAGAGEGGGPAQGGRQGRGGRGQRGGAPGGAPGTAVVVKDGKAGAGQTTELKTADAKPGEGETAEVAHKDEAKPADTTAIKPVDGKPGETKPDSKPAESKPGETKPADAGSTQAKAPARGQ